VSDKPDWPEGFVPERRVMVLYVLGIALGAMAGYMVANALRKTEEVRVSVPYAVPGPCPECAKHAAEAVAEASAELSRPAHLRSVIVPVIDIDAMREAASVEADDA